MGLRINGIDAFNANLTDAFNANLRVGNAAVAAGNPVPIFLQDPADATRQAKYDALVEVPISLDLVHYNIHEGASFFYAELTTLAAAAQRNFLIVSPDFEAKRCHLFFDVQTNDEINIKFYEGTVTTNDGTAITEQNRNRGSTETADTTMTHTPTVSNAGTLLAEMQVGGSQGKQDGTPGTISRPEIILDVSGTKYLLRITAAGNNTDVSTWLDWYEHADS